MSLFKRKRTGQVLLWKPIDMHWDVEDPFLFASHHEDDYPKGNKQQAPPLEEIGGRDLGRDYEKRFGYRMYHGKVVPGFPSHAHWGYETITFAEKGYVDHFDFLGNQGRYGFGDVQWVTAGGRYQHCEMYPLVSSEKRNPNDITQVMLNLPLKEKNSEPSFKMLWSDNIPVFEHDGVKAKIIVGEFKGIKAPLPDERSWAADPKHHVSIVRIEMEPNVELTLPAICDDMTRNLYTIDGSGIRFGEFISTSNARIKLPGNEDVTFVNGNEKSTIWLLEGTPIKEKQASFGPVTLKTEKDVRTALETIRGTEYESWPWDIIDKAQPKDTKRFVKYSDGREEHPE